MPLLLWLKTSKIEDVKLLSSILEEMQKISSYDPFHIRFDSSWIGGKSTWLWPDGSVCGFRNIGKWPSNDEILNSAKKVAEQFPNLDINMTVFNSEVDFIEYKIAGHTNPNNTNFDLPDNPYFNIKIKNGRSIAEILPPDVSVHQFISYEHYSTMNAIDYS